MVHAPEPYRMIRTAHVVYNRIARAEAAYELSHLLNKAGWAAEANMGREECVQFGVQHEPAFERATWAQARDRASARLDQPIVQWKRLTPTAKIPTKSTPQAAGFDLYLDGSAPIVFKPGEHKLLSTGIAFCPPEGCYGRLAGRSGLAVKGFNILGGVIDADYRGEIKLVLVWHSCDTSTHILMPGDRIAQLVLERCVLAKSIESQELPSTVRGQAGFGSSGA